MLKKKKPMQTVRKWLLYLLSALVGFKVLQKLFDKYIL